MSTKKSRKGKSLIENHRRSSCFGLQSELKYGQNYGLCMYVAFRKIELITMSKPLIAKACILKKKTKEIKIKKNKHYTTF